MYHYDMYYMILYPMDIDNITYTLLILITFIVYITCVYIYLSIEKEQVKTKERGSILQQISHGKTLFEILSCLTYVALVYIIEGHVTVHIHSENHFYTNTKKYHISDIKTILCVYYLHISHHIMTVYIIFQYIYTLVMEMEEWKRDWRTVYMMHNVRRRRQRKQLIYYDLK